MCACVNRHPHYGRMSVRSIRRSGERELGPLPLLRLLEINVCALFCFVLFFHFLSLVTFCSHSRRLLIHKHNAVRSIRCRRLPDSLTLFGDRDRDMQRDSCRTELATYPGNPVARGNPLPGTTSVTGGTVTKSTMMAVHELPVLSCVCAYPHRKLKPKIIFSFHHKCTAFSISTQRTLCTTSRKLYRTIIITSWLASGTPTSLASLPSTLSSSGAALRCPRFHDHS